MKKLSILIIIVFILFAGFSYGQKEEDIVIGKQLTIKSDILNSNREILISLPNSYNYNNYREYPVLYLLDGKKFFNSFTGVVTQLSSDASPQLPEMIVVGITSQNRIKDSSPTNSSIGYLGKEERGLKVSGGADDFLSFLEKELILYIDNKYRTNSYRMLAGYSFTGLAVIHSLFSNPRIFNSYLVIDFSAWWDNEIMLSRLRKFTEDYNGPLREIYLTTTDRVLNTVYKEKINSGWTFIQEFEKRLPENINLGYKKYEYKEENHHSMPLISFIDGLKYIFREHMINYDEMYSSPNLIKAKFDKLSKRLGYKVRLPEGLISFLGYQFLYAHPDIDKAIFYFEYNTKSYPLSSNAWSSLADAYLAKKDKSKAIDYLKKSLELNPKNDTVKEQLKKLIE